MLRSSDVESVAKEWVVFRSSDVESVAKEWEVLKNISLFK